MAAIKLITSCFFIKSKLTVLYFSFIYLDLLMHFLRNLMISSCDRYTLCLETDLHGFPVVVKDPELVQDGSHVLIQLLYVLSRLLAK